MGAKWLKDRRRVVVEGQKVEVAEGQKEGWRVGWFFLWLKDRGVGVAEGQRKRS